MAVSFWTYHCHHRLVLQILQAHSFYWMISLAVIWPYHNSCFVCAILTALHTPVMYLINYPTCLCWCSKIRSFLSLHWKNNSSILYASLNFAYYVYFISLTSFAQGSIWRDFELERLVLVVSLKSRPRFYPPAYSLKVLTLLVSYRQSWQHARRRLLYNQPDAVSMLASGGEKQ